MMININKELEKMDDVGVKGRNKHKYASVCMRVCGLPIN